MSLMDWLGSSSRKNSTPDLRWIEGLALIRHEAQMLLTGRLLSEMIGRKSRISSLREVEFKVFSQWGDDGIIQWLIHRLDFPHRTFMEFGVGDYRESNTRFLMMNNGWSGLVMDSSAVHVEQIIRSEYYWKYGLTAKAAFVDKGNINELIADPGFDRNVGILHIDLDGMDYWIWSAIEAIRPVVVILEYNSVFGIDRSITVPYDAKFDRTRAHHSNLYFGASLRALQELSKDKGYAFIGSNSAGLNAYFVRHDCLNDEVREVSVEDGFVLSQFRESRDAHGRLTYQSGSERLAAIRGLPVYNTQTREVEPL